MHSSFETQDPAAAAGATGNDNVPPARQTPHYLAPTTAQSLPEYVNAEAEAIKQSFSKSSYRMIQHLPNELKTHQISEATAARIGENITSAYFVQPHGTYRRVGAKGQDGLFSTFDYVSEEYSLATRLLKETHTEAEKNAKPFLYSTPRPQLLNSLAGAASYEENKQYTDPYEDSSTRDRRVAFLREQQLLHGPFVPSLAAKSVGEEHIIRSKLPDIVQKLMRAIDADWNDAEFQIYCDDDDIIIVQFAAASVDNPKGLQAYMNMFVKTNAVVSEYHLTKLAELWNHTADDGYIYFGFRPPWVRRRAEESFLALHPELAAPAKLLTANAADANRKQITADDTQKLIGNTSSSSNGAANTARSGNGTSTASSGVQNTAPLPPASVGSRSSLPPR